ncbi:unnamed protein product [Urochloa humidicola]
MPSHPAPRPPARVQQRRCAGPPPAVHAPIRRKRRASTSSSTGRYLQIPLTFLSTLWCIKWVPMAAAQIQRLPAIPASPNHERKSAAVVDGACQTKSSRHPSHPCLLPRSSSSPPSVAALRVTKGGIGTALASARFRLLGCYKEDNGPHEEVLHTHSSRQCSSIVMSGDNA